MSEPTHAAPEERLRLFEAADFPAYRAWYADAELDAHLGPMDEDWLTFVLADKDGRQFSYLAQEKLVAVIGVAPDPDLDAWVVTDIAVDPALRGLGWAGRALTSLMRHEALGARPRRLAYVMSDNPGARRFFTAQGWRCITETKADDMALFEAPRP
ncbi:GNAT family N-acetyltransferase [Brevundimonas pondensis]|uniref:GNAT family N-acetyltransferase n=1 Tax=Brevundimonas pondensis TaxID=2774189 RepID=UPI003207D3CF